MRTVRTLVPAAVCAGTLALGALLAPPAAASTGEDARSAAGTTTVVLDPALVPVLTGTLHVTPIPPGQLSAPGGRAQLSFPITEVEGKEIEHSGGLRFTPVGGGSLRITEFEIDQRKGVLSAETKLNGKRLGEVEVFRLGPARPIDGRVPACRGVQAGLTLTAAAAGALNAPSFAGAFVGDACVVPER